MDTDALASDWARQLVDAATATADYVASVSNEELADYHVIAATRYHVMTMQMGTPEKMNLVEHVAAANSQWDAWAPIGAQKQLKDALDQLWEGVLWEDS